MGDVREFRITVGTITFIKREEGGEEGKNGGKEVQNMAVKTMDTGSEAVGKREGEAALTPLEMQSSNDAARGSEEEQSHHRRLPCAACYPTPALLNSGDDYGGDAAADGADLLRCPSVSFV
jgi:hypothetical protein